MALLLSPIRASSETPLAKPFVERVLLSATTVDGTFDCPNGVGMNGVALDVRDGTFDGLWWNSVCLFSWGAAGRWYIYYINGQFASAITGWWRANKIQVGKNSVAYVGTYELSDGFGPWAGITGRGEFTLQIGAQQWVAMEGEATLAS